MFVATRVSVHRGADDLLTAGLGLEGLRRMQAPGLTDPGHPTSDELRRRAIWHNWRAIADLSPGGGFGSVYGSTAQVPGREFSAFASLPGARQPHRVLLQVPDHFDWRRPCVVVTASSGSRGIYGAIAVAGAWGLPKGYAVAYTDKGAGTDYFDLDADAGVQLDGCSGLRERGLAFAPEPGGHGIAVKHAHSRDNPEADWGRHVMQAAEFALLALAEAFPEQAAFTFDNTRVIAVGLSNGGGAVLRAAECEDGRLAAVVAGEPNIHVDGVGARCLYDYTTEAALWMPAALLHFGPGQLPQMLATGSFPASWQQRCAGLKALGWVEGADSAAQAAFAHAYLRAQGWSDAAMRAAFPCTALDLWRSIAVTYASAHGRYGPGEHPCGHTFRSKIAMPMRGDADAVDHAASWSLGAGIAEDACVAIVEAGAEGPDPTLPGLRSLRALCEGEGADAQRVRTGMRETRAGLPRRELPVVVVHGVDDGLVPMAFSSAPYVAGAQAAGCEMRYWRVQKAQHFDAFLAFPDFAARYVPLLPYVHAALDRVCATLDRAAGLPADALIDPSPRGANGSLERAQLALPD